MLLLDRITFLLSSLQQDGILTAVKFVHLRRHPGIQIHTTPNPKIGNRWTNFR